MTFIRPTLPELIDRIEADFESRLELVGAVLRRAVVTVVSRVLAGASHMLHGHLEFLGAQLFADKSEAEFLIRQAAIFGFSQKSPAFARATVTLTGTNGIVVPAGTVLLRSDNVEYTTDADATIASGTASAAVTASLADANSTLTVGVVLNFESPIDQVSSTATVATVVQDGSDLEDVEAFRARFLARLQTPPQGGSAADYVAWALEVSGVTRAWVYPQESGAGTVTVRFMRDNDSGSAIPDSGEVAAVQAHLNDVRPVTATVTALAPIATTQNFTVTATPNTADTQAAIRAALTDLITRVGQPGGTLKYSDAFTAAREAAGVTDLAMSVPAGNVTYSTGHIPQMGTVTFL